MKYLGTDYLCKTKTIRCKNILYILYYKHILFISALKWILSPEPTAKPAPALVVEDLLLSEGFINDPNPMLWLRKMMVVPDNIQEETVRALMGQRTNPMWSIMRKYRITASVFGAVLSAANR